MEFTLNEDQVPEPPNSTSWADSLRWMLIVMDPDDTRMSFIASCFSQCLQNGFLTQKQHKVCLRMLYSIRDDYLRGILLCQNVPGPMAEIHASDGRLN